MLMEQDQINNVEIGNNFLTVTGGSQGWNQRNSAGVIKTQGSILTKQ